MAANTRSERSGTQVALSDAPQMHPARRSPEGHAARRGRLHACAETGAWGRPDVERAGFVGFGEDYELDLQRGALRKAGELVDVHRTPLRLLVYLVRNADRIVPKEELLEQVWEGTLVSDTAIASALKELRHVLGDDGARQGVIQTRRGSGYRFVAPLRCRAGPAARTAAAPASLAVLPLESLSQDGPKDRLALGMTDALIGALAQIGSLDLLPRAAVMRLNGRASHSSVRDIGRELGADLLVTGTIDRDGPRVRVCAELLDVASEGLLWTGHYERELGNFIELEGEVARAVEHDIRQALAPGGAP